MLSVMRLTLLSCLLALAIPCSRAAEWTIFIYDYYFTPTNLTIAPGDTVIWVNLGFEQHDTTGANGAWTSPLLFAEESFPLRPGEPGYPFNQSGQFPYICEKHIEDYPWQTGLIVVASANLPPNVQIASPANGAGFLAPASFTITADASDSDGSVTSVQFFVNGNPAGTSPGPIFSANVSGLVAGNYTLTAIATDDLGATGPSPPIGISVTNPPVVEKFPLTLSVSPPGSGTVTAEPPQPIDGYNSGTMVTLTASAGNGFAFSNWSGSVSSLQNPLVITMDSGKNITANFAVSATPTYTLTIITNPPGSGTVTVTPAPNGAGGTYLEGTVVTLTATPAVDFAFTNWTGDVSSAANVITLTMSANRSVTANFFESIVPRFTLTVLTNPPGAGSIVMAPPPNAPNGRYLEGTTVTLTATPIGTNAFTNWTGAVSSTSNRIMLVIDADKTVTANFVPVIPPTFTLTINVVPTNGGTVLVTPPANSNGTYSANVTVALSAQPNPGFRFVRWTGAVASSNALVQVLMNGNKTVTATFEPIPPLDFALLKGAWAGLLLDERDTNFTTSGLLTLRVSKTGAFRGNATIAGMRSFVAGQFDRFGYAPLVMRRGTLNGSLQIDAEAGLMNGSLTDGREISTLLLYRTLTPTNAGMFAGTYSLVFDAVPPVENEGSGTLRIMDSASVRSRDTLGDGTAFSNRSFVTADGRIPFFAQLYGNHGSLVGWLNTDGTAVQGNLRWFRPGDSRRSDFPGGFAIMVPVVGVRVE
jgi:hypothetical protein